MHKRQYLIISISLILFFSVFLGACKHVSPTATPTSVDTLSAEPSLELVIIASSTSQPYPAPSDTSIAPPTSEAYPIPTSLHSLPKPGWLIHNHKLLRMQDHQQHILRPLQSATQEKTIQPSPQNTPTTETPTNDSYRACRPAISGTRDPAYQSLYPGPQITNTPLPYPGPATSTTQPTRTPSTTPRKTSTQPFGRTPSSGTPAITATDLPPRPPLSPPPAGSSVTIWHSWGISETETLKSIIQSFQRIYPDVTFNLLYVPLDDLYNTYQGAAYLGKGPSLLLGPAEWGPALFDGDLITDLSPFVPPDYLTNINSAALGSGEYRASLISLPLSQHGMLMYRNIAIINSAPKTFDELVMLSASGYPWRCGWFLSGEGIILLCCQHHWFGWEDDGRRWIPIV